MAYLNFTFVNKQASSLNKYKQVMALHRNIASMTTHEYMSHYVVNKDPLLMPWHV